MVQAAWWAHSKEKFRSGAEPLLRHTLSAPSLSRWPLHRSQDDSGYITSAVACISRPPIHTNTTAFGRCKGTFPRTSVPPALILLDVQIVSARPSPHTLNTLPPPDGF
ncbi:hypothetical protein P154DRAFT_573004 [Amniculicola lignicola CBS 123094]|uniref:Uncharacterized protein n=1 Tax=Amniculicola lignicola CBS 123094 TaxID=1392246 RepID=A0A6A5WT85_9PLEO|nr:hypothetical protein P154DRAFT_573004 [Amniculicola lignicola CBS 123094]